MLENNKLKFNILKKKWNWRIWEIELNGVKVKTPIFMPVWTKATIKWMMLDLLKSWDYLWTDERVKVILANTFHLYLRPWDEIVKLNWWLHKFENWDWLILTDSGGFQVFSLWLWKKDDKNFKHKVRLKLTEEWVKFYSPYDWSKHFFTPEKVVDIQMNLWSDIMMVLDVCSPSDADKKTIYEQMQMTHRWAKRAFNYFESKYDKARWVLFPIVQWWIYKEFRQESIEYLSQFAWDWIAVWWVSVGESRELINDIVEFTWNKLPENKPRYLMWVWTPEDIKFWIENWFDMFDCVLATRLWRHWVAFSDEWNIKITNSKYKTDTTPLSTTCNCHTCKNFSKSYLHHLIKEKEVLWWVLLSLHNIAYLHKILEEWKKL